MPSLLSLATSRTARSGFSVTQAYHAVKPGVKVTAGSPSKQLQQDELLHADYKPVRQASSVKVINLGDSDAFGLETRTPLGPGTLVLCVEPVVAVEGQAQQLDGFVDEAELGDDAQDGEDEDEAEEEGNEASSTGLDDMYEQLLQQAALQLSSSPCSQLQRAWLSHLDPAASPASRLTAAQAQATLQGNSESPELPNPPTTTPPRTYADLLRQHALFEPSPDLLLSGLGLTPSTACSLGLWPEHALLAHSCVPNTAAYSHRDHLHVRLARKYSSKTLLYRSLLPSEDLFAPLSVRAAALMKLTGTSCQCPRCSSEAAQPKALTSLVNDIYAACRQLRLDLAAAINGERGRSVEVICDQLRIYVELLDAAFVKSKVADSDQAWLQAAVFDLYELLYVAVSSDDDELVDPRLSELLTMLAAEVAPGSELHVHWASMHLADVEALEAASESPDPMDMPGRKSAGVKYAEQLAQRAYVARYGALSASGFRQLRSSHQALLAPEDE